MLAQVAALAGQATLVVINIDYNSRVFINGQPATLRQNEPMAGLNETKKIMHF